MNVIFVEPSFPNNQREFVRALHSVGARVTGIGERPAEWLDDEVKSWLVAYEQVGSVTNEHHFTGSRSPRAVKRMGRSP